MIKFFPVYTENEKIYSYEIQAYSWNLFGDIFDI